MPIARPVLPPANHVLIGTDSTPDIPNGTAEKRFYDWLSAIQRQVGVPGHVIGSTDGGDALPGEVGEYVSGERIQGLALGLTSGVLANVTSVNLTAGDWRVWFNGRFWPTAGSTITGAEFSLSTVSVTTQDAPSSRSAFLPVPDGGMVGGGAFQLMNVNVGPTRIVTATALTVFAVALASFAGTLRAYGHLQAERRR